MANPIGWCSKTWSPVSGCTKVSEACRSCYAEVMAKRLQAMGMKGYENGFAVTMHPDKLNEPYKWKKPQRIFVPSMGDLFHEDLPYQFVNQVIATIAKCPQHTFLLLTKRATLMKIYFNSVPIEYLVDTDERSFGGRGFVYGEEFKWPLPNLWLGVTAENQEMADKRIPELLKISAAGHFVSIEPMLGAIDLSRFVPKHPFYNAVCENCEYVASTEFFDKERYHDDVDVICPECYHPTTAKEVGKIDWVIVGGENGKGARVMEHEWVDDIVEQAKSANVSLWFKGWGTANKDTEPYYVTIRRELPKGVVQ